MSGCKLAIFNLPDDTREADIDDIFGKFGKITRVALREGRNSKMCFLEYDDPRDAEDAVDRRNDYEFGSNRLRVEFSHGGKGKGRGGGRDSRRRDSRGRGGGRGGGGRGGRDSRSRRRPPPPRTHGLNNNWHKVVVTGLPPGASWQDMKDFFRPEAQAKYTDVTGAGEGVAGFATADDAERVVERLNGGTFKDRDGRGGTTVRLVYEQKDDSRGRSRSRSR